MKTCSTCKISKPLDQFNKKGIYLHSICKSCNKIYQAEWYKQNIHLVKSRTKISNIKAKKRNRQYVIEYKLNKGCQFCPERHPVALDFHHTSNDKEYGVARLAQSSNSIEFINQEISKCIVVCSNCHRKIHAGIIKVPQVEVESTKCCV